MGHLSGVPVLVTSGGQGIGKAICESLILHGAKVVTTYLTSKEGVADLERTAAKAGMEFLAIEADLTSKAECEQVVARAAEFLSGLQVVVNNAGSLIERRSIEALDEEFVLDSVALNLLSTMWVTRAAVPYLSEREDGASVVNLASLAGRKGGHSGSIAYSTTKGAVITWTRHAAAELGGRGIRVNCVAPGLILGTSFHATHTTKESAQQTIDSIPLGRAGAPDDVARVVSFLAAEYDGFISGITLDINGGAYTA